MKTSFSFAVLTVALAAVYPIAHAQVAVNAATTQDANAASSVYRVGSYAANAAVGEIKLAMNTATVPADGQTATVVTIQLFDRKGNPLKGDALATIESSGGRILLDGARTDELGPGKLDVDRVTTGTQLRVTDGRATFRVIAPSMPTESKIRVTAGDAFATAQMSFIPEMREMLVNGLIEGVIALRRVKNESAITQLRSNDGFDEALTRFERSFRNGDGTAAARAAFFVKGTVTGQTLLTASYDTDKETRARMLRDIRAEEIYPVMGDASIKGYDAKSSNRLYVRLDNGKNYALYGDFSTGDGFSQQSGAGNVASVRQRDLGNYNRTLTGARAHIEGEAGFINVFGAKDTLRQLVEEFRGNGGSFYNTSNSNGVENTEKIEIIVRDRANPGRIVSVQTLQRFADYTFEPFNGRILIKGPVQSVDGAGNPQSLRISYEVDQGGAKYATMGVDGQVNLGGVATIGGSYVKDKNPTVPTAANERVLNQLSSVNAGINLGQNVRVVAEVARTINETSAGEITGKAVRAELAAATSAAAGTKPTLSGSVSYAKADVGFYNAGSSVNDGKSDLAAKATVQLTQNLAIKGEITKSSDINPNVVTIAHPNGAERKGAYLGADWQVSDAVGLTLGVRKSQDNGSGLYSASSANGSVNTLYPGGLFSSGIGTNGLQTPQSGTATGNPLDATTIVAGVRAKVSSALTLGVEGEFGKNKLGNTTVQTTDDKSNRLAATADYQIAERTKITARYETQTGLGSYNDRANRANAFSMGVTNTYLNQGSTQGELFSEYRLRDAIGGRESQIASGLRNTFDVAEGLKAVAGAEYIKVLNGTQAPSWALAGGLDYTGSELWKSSGRLEYRKTDNTSLATTGSNSIMSTITVARKLDRNWTLLGRNYFAQTDAVATAGKQMQDRAQIGFAYRPVDTSRFDLLGKLEYKIENNSEAIVPEKRKAIIASLSGNWHPARSWWVSGRVAAKTATETTGSLNDKFSAFLVSGRVLWDITDRWDAGVLASVMSGQGSRQYAYGLETGYTVRRNLWLSLGYNFAGFTDKDLTGNEYTAKGPYIRLRAKFDENLFGGDPLAPTGSTNK